MKEVVKVEGVNMFPYVQSLVLTRDEDFHHKNFIDQFSNKKLRYRCLFKKSKEQADKLDVYFHLHESEELEDLSSLPKKICMYGAFRQTVVFQMKSSGNIREMTEEEKSKFTRLVTERLNGKNIGDILPTTPSREETLKALEFLKSGKFYYFEPLNYGYRTYLNN